MWNCYYLHYYFIFYYNTSILISGRPVCNLRFIYDIDLMVSSTIELQDMTNKLVEIAGAYGMERNIEKSKVMVNSTSNTSVGITIGSEPLKSSFKYLGVTLSNYGTCNAEIYTWIATTAMAGNDMEEQHHFKIP